MDWTAEFIRPDSLLGKHHIEIRHPSKFFPIAYDTSESVYYAMGEGVDTAFKDGAKLK